MNLLIKDKVYIIAGSSRGIGKQIAHELLENEAKVVLTGRNKDNLEKTYNEFKREFGDKLIMQIGDISNFKILLEMKKKIIKKWNKIDGIVANAGNLKKNSKNEFLDVDWYIQNNFENIKVFYNFFEKSLIKYKGSAVFISSIAAIKDLGAPIGYVLSKRYINEFAKSMAIKNAKNKIRINIVSPGNIIYPGGNWDKKLKKNPKKINNYIYKEVPLKKFGKPEDISSIVAFLLSEKSNFITGSNLIVDGGQTIKD